LQETTAREPAKHWGLLGTLIWGALVALVHIVVSAVVAGIYVGATRGPLSPQELSQTMHDIQFDGMAVSFTTLASAFISILLLLLVVRFKRGSDIREYLGLRFPSKREAGRWLLFFVAFLAALDLLTYMLGKPIVPEFMWRVYSSAGAHWTLWIALIVAAPLVEELFFRGFLLKGLAASPLGAVGAVVLTSAAWAVIHAQYDAYGIGSIFAMGLILGTARIKTGSTILTILLHAAANLVATIETVVFLSYFGDKI
jgi:membrane protease YdiL (CAAX protease family)